MNLKNSLMDIQKGLTGAFHAMMKQDRMSLAVHSSKKNTTSFKTRIEVFLSALKSSYPRSFEC